MTDYTWPTDLPPFVQSFYLQPHTGRSVSPFTRQQKVYGLSEPMWITRLSFRGGYNGETGEAAFGGRLDAMLVKLAGGENRALVYDFRRPTRTGAGESMQELVGTTWTFDGGELFSPGGNSFVVTWSGGAPTNEAAAAGATSMTWSGFQPLAVIFNAGDYVGGDGRAHLVTDAATADVDGEVTISFQPPLEAAIAAGAGSFTRVTSPFRLVSDDAGANPAEVGQAVAIDFEMVEDL